MEENVQETSQKVDRAEADLRRAITAKEPTCSGLESQLSKLRNVCQDLFFLDLEVAEAKEVETRLWRAHQDVNKEFRSYLGRLRHEDNKKKAVERRKADKLYLDFIKSSHRFYRGFIQRICSHFSGLGEIYDIARKMHLETLSVDTPVEVDMVQKQNLLRSCHMTLIQCGDLSRYREIELSRKERNWGPAKGYYECAAELDPTSGHSFNQLSVMALADSDHFRALYYIYRTLSIAKPFPTAAGNLALELRKIGSKTIPPAGTETKLGAAEVPFLKLHAMSYAGENPANFRSACDALMMALSDVIRAQPCNKSLKRVCLINIAASHQALKMIQSPITEMTYNQESLLQTYGMLQSLNASTFTLLLLTCASELRAISRSAVESAESMVGKSRVMTAVVRRTLPCLRIYAAWLLTDLKTMVGMAELDTEFRICLNSLWDAFAACNNEFMAIFPITQLPDIPYLLDEDQDMLHFTPFGPAVSDAYFCTVSGTIKPHRDQVKSLTLVPAERPDYEMMHRIKHLVTLGAHFHRHRNDYSTPLPFYLAQGAFRFDPPNDDDNQQEPDPVNHLDPNLNHSQPLDSMREKENHNPSASMAEMVDDLVGAERSVPRTISSSRLMGSPQLQARAGNERSRPSSTSFNASDLVRQTSHQGSPIGPAFSTPTQTHRGSFGIYQTPFAPLPGELGTNGSRPGTSHNSSPRIGLQHGSSALFKEDLNRRQRELSGRSSPHRSLDPPTMSTISNTPTGFYTFAQAASRPSFQGTSPSPFASPMIDGEFPKKKHVPAPSFGAIGDSRPKIARTPTSGQPG